MCLCVWCTPVCVRGTQQQVTSLSRRGTPSPDSDPLPGVTFIKGDATDPAVLQQVITDGARQVVVVVIVVVLVAVVVVLVFDAVAVVAVFVVVASVCL